MVRSTGLGASGCCYRVDIAEYWSLPATPSASGWRWGFLPVAEANDPATHGEQSASDDRAAPATRHTKLLPQPKPTAKTPILARSM
jgi:hypothetical protein